tara:strand:- start:4411 stop:4575 length:165 start_codon:yes stop_codon:yes gene_type:complete
MKTIKDKLKEHFKNTPDRTVKQEWESTEVFDKINSPKVSDFLKGSDAIIGDNKR